VLAIVVTTVIGLTFGALASRSFGIYFLMLTLTYAVIANLFFGSVTQFGGFSPIAGVNLYTPRFVGDIATDRDRLYYIALVVSVVVYLLIKYITRTPFGIAFAGIRDEPVRMASLGYAVPLHRMLAFGSQRSSPRWPGFSMSGGTARLRRRTLASVRPSICSSSQSSAASGASKVPGSAPSRSSSSTTTSSNGSRPEVSPWWEGASKRSSDSSSSSSCSSRPMG
jgi:hypothetical protein